MKIINAKNETRVCYTCDNFSELSEVLEQYSTREVIYIEINRNEFHDNYIVNITYTEKSLF